ncbi:hypothetical protein G8O24_21510 [Bradyrhizobium sp. INPA01-394B]|uniref:Uncharacterized protein n=1 Tax=Bradyrhizobium campsiandrae TaxID=1729892 RepID=A0ABR7U3M6_9BRAD|nr:hypothetical protein [Bradyrhizobium campsiandrae]MBC9879922.1 hypothetical protein [Bradyrhizobium campsiandrae]MBC9978607.1 hypothetical protein [Bradyrhizobium campsiandrae]
MVRDKLAECLPIKDLLAKVATVGSGSSRAFRYFQSERIELVDGVRLQASLDPQPLDYCAKRLNLFVSCNSPRLAARWSNPCWLRAVNFQVSILKALASYPNRLATHADIKRDLAFLATSGPDWSDYSKRLGAVFPSLDVFSLGFVQRYSFGWRLTAKGEIALEMMEEAVRSTLPAAPAQAPTSDLASPEVPASDRQHSEEQATPRPAHRDRRALFKIIDGGRCNAA